MFKQLMQRVAVVFAITAAGFCAAAPEKVPVPSLRQIMADEASRSPQKTKHTKMGRFNRRAPAAVVFSYSTIGSPGFKQASDSWNFGDRELSETGE